MLCETDFFFLKGTVLAILSTWIGHLSLTYMKEKVRYIMKT